MIYYMYGSALKQWGRRWTLRNELNDDMCDVTFKQTAVHVIENNGIKTMSRLQQQ